MGAVTQELTVQLRLYTVSQISIATFLGSPVAGAILMTLNFRRLDEPTKDQFLISKKILNSGIE